MESPIKKLRQERAILGARQGDPELPANGTLFARRQRLQADLERAEHEELAVFGVQAPREYRQRLSSSGARSAVALRRDIRLVEEEIRVTQQRMDEIDRVLERYRGKE